MPQLHQQGHAARAVVCADKHALAAIHRVGIAIGQRPRVVMGAQQNALFLFRVPLDDRVDHLHFLAAARIRSHELLKPHLAAELGEVLPHQPKLLPHAGRAANPRADAQISCR